MPFTATIARRRVRASAIGLGTVLAVLLAMLGAAPTARGETVVSLTFDDGRTSQYDQARAILNAHGMRATFFVNSGAIGQSGFMTPAQLNSLADDGHEIGGHAVLHRDMTIEDPDEVRREICNDRMWLLDRGFEARNFAYPYDRHNATVRQIVAECGYNSARGGALVSNSTCRDYVPTRCAETIPPLEPYATRSPDSVEASTTLDQIMAQVTTAEENGGGWIQLNFHDVCDSCSGTYRTSTATFSALLDWLGERAASGTVVRTVDEVIGGPLKPAVAGPAVAAPTSGANALQNPSFEDPGASGFQNLLAARCWQRHGNGATPAAWSQPTDAHAGAVAQQIQVSSIESWGFHALVPAFDLGGCAPVARPGQVFRFTGWYRATAPVYLIVYYRSQAGRWQQLARSPQLGPAADWTQASYTLPALPPDGAGLSVGFWFNQVGTLTMDDVSLVDTGVAAPTETLSVAKQGSGNGAVTAGPAGIDCGPTCTTGYASGTTVTLTALAGRGSRFTGWGGACAGTAATCVVTMSAASSVTAGFEPAGAPASFPLSVTRTGDGEGAVTSSPAGIDCGSQCEARYDSGSLVTLTARASAGSAFTGWGGACSGTASTCTVTMSAAQSVTADFRPLYTLAVTKTGPGSGTVISSPGGIGCGSVCQAMFPADTVVTLTASPGSDSSFGGWGGACSGTGTCTVRMTAATSVSARFGRKGKK